MAWDLVRRLPGSRVARVAGRALDWVPPDRTLPVLTGPLKGHKWIRGAGQHSCWLGIYETTIQRALTMHMDRGMICFDVGAHAGYHTLLMARATGAEGSVLAVEPAAGNVAYLERHLALNRIHNVEVLQAAASDRDGVGLFMSGGTSYTGALSDRGQRVETVRLDSPKLPMPDLIKIDVEGAELQVLAGMSGIFDSGRRPLIILATHSAELEAGARDLLSERGYRLSHLDEDGTLFGE